MKLIDADAFAKMAYDVAYPVVHGKNDHERGLTLSGIAQLLDEMPVVEAVPVRHGKWMLEQEKFDGYGYGNWNRWSCSCCGHVRTKGWETLPEGHKPKAMLCENCGAKMDEEED